MKIVLSPFLLVALLSFPILSGCGSKGSSADNGSTGSTDTTAPSVSITSPAPGSSIAATVTLAATASDDAGVTSVQFLLDGNNLGSPDGTPPYSLAWDTTGVANGGHVLAALARDAAGNTTTSTSVNVTVNNPAPDTTAPVVSLTEPANGIISGNVNVSANATDNIGVVSVQFLLDGNPLGVMDAAAPFAMVLDTTGVVNGAHVLTATARDAAGNTTTSAPVNVTVNNVIGDTTAPNVSIAGPSAGLTISKTISVIATASDNVGVAGVRLQIDGANAGTEDTAAPYSVEWDTRAVANGTHTIAAVARDAAGNLRTSAPVSVTVSNVASAVRAAIAVGPVIADPPTLETLGVSVPIYDGDTNYNAQARTYYRVAGEVVWKEALPLLRTRPEYFTDEDPSPFAVAELFAGSIFDLLPNTAYEVRIEIEDPDGGGVTRQLTARTRAPPPLNPATPRTVNVSTLAQLTSALSAALPGDVIMLANGIYNGAITVSRSGTAANPVFVRGQSRDGVVINATGATYGATISGANVVIEDLTIRSSAWGMLLQSTNSVVVRRLRVTDVIYGIDARAGVNRNYYICDNKLEGNARVWPDNVGPWNYEGIVVSGEGHVVCYNTLSGFDDAVGQNHEFTAIPNRANDFYGNDVLWSGDNGVELDGTDRNVRAFRNRFSNCGNHSISFQPVWGGPAYAIRNIVYNNGTSPYKLNNDPTGFYILHNTVVRPGRAFQQTSGQAANFRFLNNITIGTTEAVNFTTLIIRGTETIDYNGWLPDGAFTFTDTWTSFADLQIRSPYEQHGVVLTGLPFETALTIPSGYQTFVAPLDARLSAATNALDRALRLPNINDDFSGIGPDLGAVERGFAYPNFGVRPN